MSFGTIPEPQIHIEKTETYRLLDDYHYVWNAEGTFWCVTVPEGFIFDGASIPWAVQPFIGKWDLGKGPPCVHDYFYEYKGDLPNGHFQRWSDNKFITDNRVWTRYNVDRLFARHMRMVGVSKWKRRSAYLTIRAFGWYNW